MKGKRLYILGLFLACSGALGLFAIPGDGMAAVADDQAVQIIGGQYCQAYIVDKPGCGQSCGGGQSCPAQGNLYKVYYPGMGQIGNPNVGGNCVFNGTSCGFFQNLPPCI